MGKNSLCLDKEERGSSYIGRDFSLLLCSYYINTSGRDFVDVAIVATAPVGECKKCFSIVGKLASGNVSGLEKETVQRGLLNIRRTFVACECSRWFVYIEAFAWPGLGGMPGRMSWHLCCTLDAFKDL